MGAIGRDASESSAVVLGYRAGEALAQLTSGSWTSSSRWESFEMVLVANFHEDSADPHP